MLRREHASIQDALFEIQDGNVSRACFILERLAREAEEQFAMEDDWHDELEADAIPLNREAA